MNNLDIFDIHSKKEYNFNNIFDDNNDLLIFKQMYNIDPLKIDFFENPDDNINNNGEIKIYNTLYNYKEDINKQIKKQIYFLAKKETVKLESYKQNFILNGWFLLDYYSKKLIHDRGNLVPCYICMNCVNQDHIMFCRVINKDIIKPYSEKMDNLFVICNSCFISNTCVKAPKNFGDIQNHLTRLSSRYYDMKTKIFFINKNINKQDIVIEYYKSVINSNKLILNTLTEENNDILNNIQIENNKHTELKQIKKDNELAFKKIRQQYQNITKDINKMVSNTTNSFINMNSVVLNSRTMIQNKLNNNLNTIESLAETNQNTNYNCKICYNNKINYALHPCGHTLCLNCSETIKKTYPNGINSCPFCKQSIISYNKIFLS